MADLRPLLLLGHPNIPPERLIAYEDHDTGVPVVLYLHQSALLDPRLENPWTPISRDGRGYLIHPEAVKSHTYRQPVFGCVYRVVRGLDDFLGIELVDPIKERDLVNQLVEEARAPRAFY